MAITGSPTSIPLYDSMELLGRDLVRERLRNALDLVGAPSKTSKRAGTVEEAGRMIARSLAAGKGTRMKSAHPKCCTRSAAGRCCGTSCARCGDAGVDDIVVVTNAELEAHRATSAYGASCSPSNAAPDMRCKSRSGA